LDTVHYLHDQFASGEVVEIDGKRIALPLIFYHGMTVPRGGEAYVGEFTKKLTRQVGKVHVETQMGQERERLPWPAWLAYTGLAQRVSFPQRLVHKLEYDGVHLSLGAARQLGESQAAELQKYQGFGGNVGEQ
jgi:hypothetical protein